MPKTLLRTWIGICILLTLLSGCFMVPGTGVPFTPTVTSADTYTPIPPTLTATQTPTASQTPIPSSTSTPEPLGCQKPPEDYTRVEVNNGQTLNQRTLAMLAHAQQLYGGEIEITGYAITQGSYTNALSASFGTHGGEARSISPCCARGPIQYCGMI
jgi:hypothetical protein